MSEENVKDFSRQTIIESIFSSRLKPHCWKESQTEKLLKYLIIKSDREDHSMYWHVFLILHKLMRNGFSKLRDPLVSFFVSSYVVRGKEGWPQNSLGFTSFFCTAAYESSANWGCIWSKCYHGGRLSAFLVFYFDPLFSCLFCVFFFPVL